MIDIDKLNESGLLKDLTDEQKQAVAELSKNDEDMVIKAKVREIHDLYDADFLAASGIKKNAGEKSYAYGKRVISELKQAVEDSSGNGEPDAAAKKTIADLQKKLSDATALAKQWEDKHTTEVAALTQKVAEREKQVVMSIVDMELENAAKGLKYKPDSIVPEDLRKLTLSAAKSKLLADYTPEILQGDGGQPVILWRDKSGQEVRVKEKNLALATAEDLLKPNLLPILDTGKHTEGAGSRAPGGKIDGSSFVIDAKNRPEAIAQIQKHLVSVGMERGTPEFQQKQTELVKENKVDELPMQ